MKAAILLAAAAIAVAAAPRAAQPPTGRRAAPVRPAPDRRAPLDPSRSVYLDDQSGVPNGMAPVLAALRTAKLWTIRDQRAAADLILQIAPVRASTAGSRGGAQSGYELSVRPARSSSAAPLWHAVAASPDALARRLRADLAPSVCVAVWCR